MRIIYLPLCVVALMICGCEKDASSTEAKEERNPLVKTGLSYMEIGKYDKAEASFKQAIESDPRMARPYLDLATIYHQYKPDYISAIFYYKRYLELRPDSEKALFIQEQIEKVQIALANAILTQSGAVQAMKELQQLREENADLKRQLEGRSTTTTATQQKVTTTTAQPTTQKSVTDTIPKSAKPASSSETTHKIYHVVAGDTLSKIASQFYGESGQWDLIYQANKDRMKTPSDLRVGQTLVIPAAQ